MPQNKKRKKSETEESFSEIANSPFLEHFYAQVSGEIFSINKNAITLKKDKSKLELLIGKEIPLFVSKTTISKKGDKKTKEAKVADIKKGDYAIINIRMLFSRGWQVEGVNIRKTK